jgi:curved DNA-binding protein
MSKDYYKILGVEKNASQDEIKKAFRKGAMKHHPDKGGDEKKFKEMNEAYAVLSDENKKSQYYQFGSTDGAGFGGPGGFDFSGFQNGQNVDFDLGDIFNQFFGGRAQRQRKGANVQVDVDLDFKESVVGTKKKVSFYKNKSKEKTQLEINIPAGINNGEVLKVRGMGEPIEDGVPGDLYVQVHVAPHPQLQKNGAHLVTQLEVSITEATLGTKKEVPTIDKPVKVKIPAGTNTGDVLRVKGEGVKFSEHRRGDLLISLKVNIPTKVSKKVKKLLEELSKEGL